MPDELIKKKWYDTWWKLLLVPIILVIIFFATVFLVYLIQALKKSGNIQAQTDDILGQKRYEVNIDKNSSIGAKDPKITIIQFADFACIHCRNTFSTIRELSVRHKDDVRIVFKDYPVVTDNSYALALGARCAGEQGLFWQMHDKLFLNGGPADKAGLIEYGKQIGADAERMEKCINENKYQSEIQKDFKEGQDLGIEGTPTWFINGYKIAGDIPYSGFEGIIKLLIVD